MLKRSWLSIIRKPSRTILLSLILFAMANLVLAALIIRSAVNASMDFAKQSLGGTVSLQADMEKLRSEQQSQIEEGGDPREMMRSFTRPQISKTIADQISSYSDYVKDYSYSISTAATSSDDLEVIESTNSFGGMMGGGFPNSDDEDEDTLDSDVTVQGLNAYAYISAVQNESMTIKDGDYFNEDSLDQVMISYELAELNTLAVGDSIVLLNSYTEEEISLTILGIYDTSEENANANLLYMNTDTAAKFMDEDDYNDGDYSVQNVQYYMLNSEFAEEFVAKINSDFPSLAEDNLAIAIDTTTYDNTVSSISQVGSFATTILIIVIIASIAIITLIITINIKDRRYEMGVLLSLGASKQNILGQIASELLIMGTLSFILASFTSSFFAKAMGQGILESQTASSQQQSENNFGRPGARVGGGGGSSRGNSNSEMPSASMPSSNNFSQNSNSNSSTITELDINASASDFILLFVFGYITILVSLAIPAINVLRYQPKEILSGKE